MLPVLAPTFKPIKTICSVSPISLAYAIACEQALLFGRVKRISRELASERRSREGPPSLARSREVHFACPNRRVCSQGIRQSPINRCLKTKSNYQRTKLTRNWKFNQATLVKTILETGKEN